MSADSAVPPISPSSPPQHILIIGCGVFGLSTALSLLRRPSSFPPSQTRFTLLDASPTLPNPSGSSVDASRIVRADYASARYARLALSAQKLWRTTDWGKDGRYHQPGFLLTAEQGREWYVDKCLANVSELASQPGWGLEASQIESLPGEDAIRRASGYADISGERGYVNWGSGWADAEACVAWAVERIKEEGKGRVEFRTGAKVSKLLYSPRDGHQFNCTGAALESGEKIHADLTIVAAGAWSPALVDLTGRCVATGQCLAYLDITDDEQEQMGHRPTVMNMSRGIFIIPPRNNELKVARHGYGYRHLKRIPNPDPSGTPSVDDTRNHTNGVNGISHANPHKTTSDDVTTSHSHPEKIEISLPTTGVPIPDEASDACRQALRDFLPHMATRPFSRTRLCWYCDS